MNQVEFDVLGAVRTLSDQLSHTAIHWLAEGQHVPGADTLSMDELQQFAAEKYIDIQEVIRRSVIVLLASQNTPIDDLVAFCRAQFEGEQNPLLNLVREACASIAKENKS